MKKYLLTFVLASFFLNGQSKTWTVISSGLTFSPATVTIAQGDSVNFTLESSHNAVEVSQTVWNAGGSTSNNGFSVPFSGGMVTPPKLTVGTHYYVCTPHASMGMKGKIIVQAATGLTPIKAETHMEVYPNPVVNRFTIKVSAVKPTLVDAQLFDLQGRFVETLLSKTPIAESFEQSFSRSGSMASGIYFIRLSDGTHTSVQKLVVM